jgi:hypothetical protein
MRRSAKGLLWCQYGIITAFFAVNLLIRMRWSAGFGCYNYKDEYKDAFKIIFFHKKRKLPETFTLQRVLSRSKAFCFKALRTKKRPPKRGRFHGAGGQNRTDNLLITNELLYH